MNVYFSSALRPQAMPVRPAFAASTAGLTPRFAGLSPLIPTLFSDLDGTWAKDLDAPLSAERRELQQYVSGLRRDGRLQTVFITARPAPRVLGIDQLMEPDYTVTENGSYIYEGLPTPDKQPDADWNNYLLGEIAKDRFDTKVIGDALDSQAATRDFKFTLKSIGDLFGSGMEQHSPFQVTRVLDNSQIKSPEQLDLFKQRLSARLKRLGVKRFAINTYPYHGKPFTVLDVMTPAANKGDALLYLKDKFDLREHMTTVAGDGGNDGFLLEPGPPQWQDHQEGGIRSERHALIVGSNQKLREQTDAKMSVGHKILSDPEMDPSLAVKAGLKHFLNAMLWADYYDGQGIYEVVRDKLAVDLRARETAEA